MNNHNRNYNSSKLQDFKSFGCKVLLGQPVLSFAQPFVTVAFRYSPRAEEYRKTHNLCSFRLEGVIKIFIPTCLL